jgi:hypothetical protein
MKVEVSEAVEELKRQFNSSSFQVTEDGQGGVHVVIDPVTIGPNFRPESTWIGFHIAAQYPYADIYPVFMGGNVVRADGKPFVAPVTPNNNFQGRPAIQISRRNTAAQSGQQKASAKILKIIHFLENLP